LATSSSGEENGLGFVNFVITAQQKNRLPPARWLPIRMILSRKLIAEAEKKTGKQGSTIVAFCLAK